MNITNVNQKVMISNPKEMEVENKNINTITDSKSAVISGNTDISISEETRSTGICQTVVETNVASLSGVLAQDDKPTDYKEALDYVVNTMTEEDYEAILEDGIVLEECEVGQLECVLQRRKEDTEFRKETPDKQAENTAVRREAPDRQTESSAVRRETPNKQAENTAVRRETLNRRAEKKELKKENQEDVEQIVNSDEYKSSTAKGADTEKHKAPVVKETDTEKYKALAAKADVDKYKDPMAKEVVQKLVDANLPVTDANVSAMLSALKLSDVVTQLSEDGMANLISKEIPITLENMYNSQYSAIKVQAPEQAVWQEVFGQAEEILHEAGFEITEEVMEKAKWLFDHRLPISENTMDAYNSLLEFREGIDPDILLTKMAEAMQKGKPPKQADLNVVLSNKIEQAVRDFAEISEKAVVKVVENGEKLNLVYLKQAQQEITEQNVHKVLSQNIGQKVNQHTGQSVGQTTEQRVNPNAGQSVSQTTEQKVNPNTEQNVSQKVLAVEGESAAEITAYRQLEEIRLKMTLEAAHSLAGKGIRIDTSKLQDIVEGLKELEKQYYGSLLEEGNVEKTDANISLLKATTETVEGVKNMPAAVLGATLKINVAQSIENLHEAGKELKASYDKAGVAYEPLMTAPRADMGDSIQKAFRNVDSILESMDLELTEDNRRAVRILGYNRMEINEESVMAVKAYDSQVTSLVKELHPAATVELIRRGLNPLDMPMEELIDEVTQLKEELGVTAEEKYSTYLWKLQKQDAISDEERKSFVGIYRLLNNVEKTDGAAIGAVLDTGKELTMGNLLTAVRTLKNKGINVKVNDNFGALESITFSKETITEQIQTGFVANTSEPKEVSYVTNHAEETTRQNTESDVRNTVKEIIEQISPEKLAKIAETADDSKQSGPDKVLNMSLDQLKDALKQTETEPAVQRSISVEERRSYEAISHLVTNMEKMDEAEIEAAIKTVQDTGKDLTMGNLLIEVRNLKAKGTDVEVNDRFSASETVTFSKETITEQVQTGFTGKLSSQRDMSAEERESYETISRLLNNMEKINGAQLRGNSSNRSVSEEIPRQNTVSYEQNTVKEIIKQISPEKLAKIAESVDDSKQSGPDKVLNMPLDQLKDALKEIEVKPTLQSNSKAEERRSYEAVSRFVASMEKMDRAEVEAVIEEVRDTEKPLTIGNLITAVRVLRNKETGLDQIQNGLVEKALELEGNLSDIVGSGEMLRQNTLTYQQNTVKEIIEQISPDKLAQIGKAADSKQSGLETLMNMTLEQLKETLKQTEAEPVVQNGISSEERKSYEAVSRLVTNMEKMDAAEVGAAVETVLNTGRALTMGNLLTAVRTLGNKGVNGKTNDRLGALESRAFSKESISEQIQAGLVGNASDTREDSSDADSSEETLRQNTLTYQQNTVKEIMEQISPDKLAQILDEDGEWAGLDKFMNMTLEQLKEALKQTKEDPALQKDYVKERLEEIRTVVGKSKEAIDYLEQYNQPVSIERLTVVLEYFVGNKNLFKEFKKYADKESDNKFEQKIAKLKEGETEELTEVMDSIWEAVDEPELLKNKYAEMEQKAEEVLQREYAAPDISSEEIKHLRLLGKGIMLTGSMSRQEHYEIPIVTGDSITNVSLTIRKGTGEKGKLQISMNSEKYGRIEVEATIKKQAINGVILCESKEGLNTINGCKKQLQDGLKEIGVTVKQLSTAISDKALERLRSSEEANSKTDTSVLYKTAKVIIKQLREIETK